MIRNPNIHRKFDRKRFEISPPLFRTFLDQTSRGKIQTVGLFFIVVSWYTCRIQRHLRSSGFFPRWCFIHSIYSICRVHRFRRISLVLNGYSRDKACPTTSLTCSIGSPLTFSAISIAVTSLLSRISRGICSSRQDLWLAISCRYNFLDYRVSDTFRILVTDVETKLDDFRRIIECSASFETKWILLLER